MKPLNQKAYGHIPHLPNSRMGPGDHHCPPGQAEICTVKTRDRHDRIIIQEKLDGSCTCVAKLLGGNIIALGKAGYLAESSPYEMHHVFAKWVEGNRRMFDKILQPGERLVGEWLAQAHGTRYALWHDPWVPFDLMRGTERTPFDEFARRLSRWFELPFVVSTFAPMGVPDAMQIIQSANYHGAIDPIEGVVYRCERQGKVDFLAKWVRPDKIDGAFLEVMTGGEPVWNWRPRQ